MYPSSLFHQTDGAALAALVAGRGLATIIGVSRGRPLAALTPVLLDGQRLRFHLARANALVPSLTAGDPALAVVAGPDAYVSPDWYEVEDQVPTWNYLTVEIEGPVRALDDAEATVLLDDLSARFEDRLAPKPPWTRHKMSPGRFEAVLRGIVAFEMTVERLEGVWKLSQNKSPDVIARVAGALADRPDEGSRRIARLMSEG